MKSIYFVFVFLFIKSAICAPKRSSSDIPTPELKLVQIVHRHGDRTPISFFPNDQLGKPEIWPDGFGQLNSKGKRRLYKMGEHLRNHYSNHYSNFLGDVCNPRSLYVRSSASDRCIESASALLAGLCPPNDRWVWCDGIDSCKNIAERWQPIAIQTVDKSLDSLLYPEADCPAAEEDRLKVIRSSEVQEKLKNSKEFIDSIAQFTNSKKLANETTMLKELMYIHDTLKCEIENEKYENAIKLENIFGKDNNIIERLHDFALLAFNYDFKTEKILRLRAGPLLGQLVKNINDVRNLKETKKLFIYTTHDTVIIPLMKALEVYNGPPIYGAGLVFELYHVNSIPEYHLNISYINHTYGNEYDTTFHHIQLPKCTSHSFCTFSEFNSSISKLIPLNWDEECGNRNSVSDSSGNKLTDEAKVGISVGVGVGVIIILLIIGMICVNQKNKNKSIKSSVEETRVKF